MIIRWPEESGSSFFIISWEIVACCGWESSDWDWIVIVNVHIKSYIAGNVAKKWCDQDSKVEGDDTKEDQEGDECPEAMEGGVLDETLRDHFRRRHRSHCVYLREHRQDEDQNESQEEMEVAMPGRPAGEENVYIGTEPEASVLAHMRSFNLLLSFLQVVIAIKIQ